MKMKKCFSLVEILVTLTFIGVMAVALLPVLTKRVKGQNANDPDCLNGYKMVTKEFHVSDNVSNGETNFNVPNGIAGLLNIIMVGGGLNGENARISPPLSSSDSEYCNLLLKEEDMMNFYTNVKYSFVYEGESANCALSQAGDSGKYFYTTLNVGKTRIGETDNVFFHSLDSGSYVLNNTSVDISKLPQGPNLGDVGDKNIYNIKTLQGGIPNVNIKLDDDTRMRGVGGSCVFNGSSYTDSIELRATGRACMIEYKTATPGSGGSSGAYASFSIVPSFNSCRINVGKGGGESLANSATTIQCGEATYASNNENSLPESHVYSDSQDGANAGIQTISGGKGGNVYSFVDKNNSENNVIYSEGAKGGCFGATKSFNCANVNGEPGYLGSGGGGGSCNEVGCGVGGRGGDGIVIIKYKEQCE